MEPSRWDALRSRSRSGGNGSGSGSGAGAFDMTPAAATAGPSRQRAASTAAPPAAEFDIEQFASAAISRLRLRSGLSRRAASPRPAPDASSSSPRSSSPPLPLAPTDGGAPPLLHVADPHGIAALPNDEWYGFYDPAFFGPGKETPRAGRARTASENATHLLDDDNIGVKVKQLDPPHSPAVSPFHELVSAQHVDLKAQADLRRGGKTPRAVHWQQQQKALDSKDKDSRHAHAQQLAASQDGRSATQQQTADQARIGHASSPDTYFPAMSVVAKAQTQHPAPHEAGMPSKAAGKVGSLALNTKPSDAAGAAGHDSSTKTGDSTGQPRSADAVDGSDGVKANDTASDASKLERRSGTQASTASTAAAELPSPTQSMRIATTPAQSFFPVESDISMQYPATYRGESTSLLRMPTAYPHAYHHGATTAAGHLSPLHYPGSADLGAVSLDGLMGASGAEFRTGDWMCISPSCSFHNFSRNTHCFGCGSAKPSSGPPTAAAARLASPTNMHTSQPQLNYHEPDERFAGYEMTMSAHAAQRGRLAFDFLNSTSVQAPPWQAPTPTMAPPQPYALQPSAHYAPQQPQQHGPLHTHQPQPSALQMHEHQQYQQYAQQQRQQQLQLQQQQDQAAQQQSHSRLADRVGSWRSRRVADLAANDVPSSSSESGSARGSFGAGSMPPMLNAGSGTQSGAQNSGMLSVAYQGPAAGMREHFARLPASNGANQTPPAWDTATIAPLASAAQLASMGVRIGPGVNPHSASAAPSGGRSSTQPPIVNTGNLGPMCVQPGDWVCSTCSFVNWRRRRVCMRCFPFAEGNEVSASLASGALVAAQLAAGIEPSADALASLAAPRRGGAATGTNSAGGAATPSARESGGRSRASVGNSSALGLAGLGLPPPPQHQQSSAPSASAAAHSSMVTTLEDKLRELKLAAASAALAASGSAQQPAAGTARGDGGGDEAMPQPRFNITAAPSAPQPIGTGRSPWGGSARPKSQPREQAQQSQQQPQQQADGSQRSSPFVPDSSWRARNVGAIGSPPTSSGAAEAKHQPAVAAVGTHELPRRPDEATRAATPAATPGTAESGAAGAPLGQRIYAGGQAVDLSLLQASAAATAAATAAADGAHKERATVATSQA